MTARRLDGGRVAIVLLAIALIAGVSLSALAAATPPMQDRSQKSCGKANALLEAGEEDAARKAYVAVLEAEPSSRCAHNGLAKVNFGNLHPAASACARGDAYLGLDRNEDAIAAFKAALEKNPHADCATDGLDEAGPNSFERHVEAIVGSLPTILTTVGLLVLALFLVLLLGYIPYLRAPIRRLWILGRLIGPRMTIEEFEDDAVEGKPGHPIAARIKERLHRMREEATSPDASDIGIDFSTPREDFAELVSENGGLKNSLEKASDISEQTKIVAAVLNLAYALLPIQRISVSATMEPPSGTGATATFMLEKNARLEAATTLRGPRPATGEPTAADYSRLADPAAVWVQYEVARVLADQREDVDAAESYALLREGLDYQNAGERIKARACYLEAIRLDPSNSSAYLNLALLDAWLAEDFDSSIKVLEVGFQAVTSEVTA